MRSYDSFESLLVRVKDNDLHAWVLLGATLGVTTHLRCHYIEPTAFGFLGFTALLNALLIVVLISSGGSTQHSLRALSVSNISFWTTLGVSLTTYRLFLNPLKRFPGPFWARLTKGAAVREAINGYTHLWLEDLHQKYGDVVRVAPNELSFRSVESLPEIHGGKSTKIAKGPWYDGIPDQPGTSMASERSLAEHKLRRRTWERGFSPKALTGYESRIVKHVNVLSKQLSARAGEVVNFSDWCDFFAFDVMGDLGFSEDFGMLRKARPHPYMVFMHHALRMVSIFSHVPWFKQLIPYLPMDNKTKSDSRSFHRISSERFHNRKQKGTESDDIFTYLLLGNEGPRKLTDPELASDAAAVIVGGSDTTSVAMTFIYYYLCKNPSTLQRLKQEIDELWDGIKPSTASLWAQAQYMNGVINEALRLVPPGPNGMQRSAPAGGCFIDGEYIPEGTQFSVHGWSIHRDERYFTRSTEFIPERWLDQERPLDFCHDSRAFIPFSIGQYGCVGKGLALLEMRLFVAELVKRFDVTLHKSFDESAFHKACRSNLSLLKGDLPLVFTERIRA